jgi:hypothetical protein
MANQLDLHRCITKMPHIKHACYERTRLYFLVYTVDHHCSLIYGRPPMTREWRSLKHPRAFLDSALARRSDGDLIGQVEYWSFGRQVFQSFGADVESPVANQRPTALEELSQAYDQWHQNWPSLQNGRITGLYFYTAKLRLLSHVFRGPSAPAPDPANAAKSDALALQAIGSAVETVQGIANAESGGWLRTLPAYFSTMIAFACVCLIKVCSQERGIDEEKKTQCRTALSQLGDILRIHGVAECSSHPLLSIAKGLGSVTIAQPTLNVPNSDTSAVPDATMGDFALDFDAFADDTFDWSFAGLDDNWTFCPEDFGTSAA